MCQIDKQVILELKAGLNAISMDHIIQVCFVALETSYTVTQRFFDVANTPTQAKRYLRCAHEKYPDTT